MIPFLRPSLLIAFICSGLCLEAAPANDPALPRPGNWAGAVGVTTMSPAPGESPGESWDSVQGSLILKITAPSRKAPRGSYTAVLSAFDGATVQTFRGKGQIGEEGRISADWVGSGKPARRCRIELDFSPAPDGLLGGYAEFVTPAESFTDANGNGQRDPGEVFTDSNGNGARDTGGVSRFSAFALCAPYSKSSPLPADVTGIVGALCLAEGAEFPLGIFTGVIDAAGKMTLRGTWQDGRIAGLVATVLRFGDEHFVLPAASLGTDIYFGARATLVPDAAGGTWVGRGNEFKASGEVRPLRFEGFRSVNNAVLNWPTGKADFYLEHDLDVEYANGLASIVEGSNKLDLSITSATIRQISLEFVPSEALVKGQLTFVAYNSNPERRVTVPLSGALNPSTGVIRGRAGSVGWFSLQPLP